MINTYSHKPA